MKQRQLGLNGPMVSAIGLGCLSFGGTFGATTDSDSQATLDAAWDQGITFFDTANIYGMGRSETMVGDWLRRSGHRPTIATKAAFCTIPTSGVDNSPAHLRNELDASLCRLGTDYVDLFYLHRHEKTRPIEEVADTMGRLIDAGKIGGYGLSEVAPYTLRRAHAVRPVRAVQNEYSLWTRLPELGLIQTCAELGVAFVPFAPLARGIFGEQEFDPANLEPHEIRAAIPRFSAENWPHNRPPIIALRAFAAQKRLSPPALALAWLLDQGPHIIPIPGTRTANHLGHWQGASDIALTAQDRVEIARLLPIGWAHGDRYSDEQTQTAERYC
jgi:aryl-alcohol dehydrogenase-like predicted oxidoreductase